MLRAYCVCVMGGHTRRSSNSSNSSNRMATTTSVWATSGVAAVLSGPPPVLPARVYIYLKGSAIFRGPRILGTRALQLEITSWYKERLVNSAVMLGQV